MAEIIDIAFASGAIYYIVPIVLLVLYMFLSFTGESGE